MLAQACGRSVAYVLRNALGKQPALKSTLSSFDVTAIRELRRIGVNINQMVRELHRRDRNAVAIPELIELDT